MQNSLIIGGETDSLEEEPFLTVQKEKAREAILAVCPEAKTISTTANTSLYVGLYIEADEQLPEKADQAIQDIYAASGLEQGEWDSLALGIRTGTDGWISISIQADRLHHCMTYQSSYSGESIQPWQDDFMQILDTDPFYKETIRNMDGL